MLLKNKRKRIWFHLALELHSNKAKKAVLDQLRHASDNREEFLQSEWTKNAQQSTMSTLIRTLAIRYFCASSLIRSKYAEGIDFDWGLGVEACLSDIEGVDDLLSKRDKRYRSRSFSYSWPFMGIGVQSIAAEWVDVGEKMESKG